MKQFCKTVEDASLSLKSGPRKQAPPSVNPEIPLLKSSRDELRDKVKRNEKLIEEL